MRVGTTIAIAATVIVVGCKDKAPSEPETRSGSASPSGSGSGSGSATVDAPGPRSGSGSAAPDPTELWAWRPANIEEAWQGAWLTKLALRDAGTTSYTGAWVAMEVTGTTAHVWAPGTKKDHTLLLVFDLPCQLELREALADGSGYNGFSKHFAISKDTVISGNGGIGYRKDKTAMICVDDDYIVLDAKGGCRKWHSTFDRWETTTIPCAWKDGTPSWVDGDGWDKEMLGVDKADYWSEYASKGGLLINVHFKDAFTGNEHVKQPDFEAAKAAALAKFKETDPLERLLTAGAKVGGMSTILDLHATFTDDTTKVKDQPIDVPGVVVEMTKSNEDKRPGWMIKAVDARDKAKRWELTCYAAIEPKALKAGAKIRMKGTGAQFWESPAINDCVVSR
jgi:hypothetical protein